MPILNVPRPHRFLADLRATLNSMYKRLDDPTFDRSCPTGGDDQEVAAGSDDDR